MDLGARLDLQEGCLDELIRALGLEWAEDDDPRVAVFAAREPLYPQYHRIGHKRQLVVRAVTGNRPLVEQHYDLLLRALVNDDDPNSPRWLAAALVQAVGRRRVRQDLAGVVEQGTPYERTCAAGALKWAD